MTMIRPANSTLNPTRGSDLDVVCAFVDSSNNPFDLTDYTVATYAVTTGYTATATKISDLGGTVRLVVEWSEDYIVGETYEVRIRLDDGSGVEYATNIITVIYQ
jgi:hypothetical protein